MKVGIGIDASVGLTFPEQAQLVQMANGRGYTSAWTPSGPLSRDGFQVCGQWAGACRGSSAAGMEFGISVIPAPVWTIQSLVNQAGSVAALSDERFILGLGTGGIYGEDYRTMHGLPDWPAVGMMRDYLTVLRGVLAGEAVTHAGKAVNVSGLKMTGSPVNVPLYLAALGPQMLRLAGELADGVCLNWTVPEHREWCRERIAEGAERAGRDPSKVVLSEYIRVCVSEDEEKARRTFAQGIMGYALGRPGASKERGYRGHFTRMGFDDLLSSVEAKRDAGAPAGELADLLPPEFLLQMGYYGKPAGARAALSKLSEGLDLAVVRIVNADPGLDGAVRTMEACSPE